MKQTFAEFACLGLLLIGTAGVVMSLFVQTPGRQLAVLSLFAVVILTACIAKWFIPAAEPVTGA
jgi:hypothetical protein